MIAEHLPALQVVLPLLAAPLCVILGRPAAAWALALIVTWASFAIAIALTVQVWGSGPISYAMGGWAPPWGIEYRVDLLNALVLLVVSGIGAVVVPYARRSVALEVAPEKQHLLYCLFLLCLSGLLGITITGDAFNLFVFLEISSLSTYALISMGSHRKALHSSFQYLIMGTIGATFLLIGVGLMYMMTGTLNMQDLSQRLVLVESTRPVLAAFAFIIVGMALKAAVFPLHLWLPNAYTYAPSAISAFIAATSTKVSLYVLLRFTFTVFGAQFAFGELALGWLLLPPAVLAAFAASAVAIFQINAKRLLAYSSVAQIGYIVMGISLTNIPGISAALVHIFNHALMKGALFCALGCVFYRLGTIRIANMAGIAKEMPFTMAAFVLGGLSLIGIPGTAGFISKWLLVQAALQLSLWWLAALLLASSLLAVAYVWRIVEMAYLRDLPEARPKVAEAPLALVLPTCLLALANLYFGIETSLPVGLAERAATELLGAY